LPSTFSGPSRRCDPRAERRRRQGRTGHRHKPGGLFTPPLSLTGHIAGGTERRPSSITSIRVHGLNMFGSRPLYALVNLECDSVRHSTMYPGATRADANHRASSRPPSRRRPFVPWGQGATAHEVSNAARVQFNPRQNSSECSQHDADRE
jgi:hypothetical protein